MNTTISQLDLIGFYTIKFYKIYRILHPRTAEYPFFSSSYGTFKINHILGHKAYLIRFLKVGIIQSVFSSQNGNKLETNNR